MNAKKNSGTQGNFAASRFCSAKKTWQRKSYHRLLPNALVISGKDGDDADRYQERDVKNALAELEQMKQQEDES
jgi:hypothetical protein